jgi:ubiquinone biosynthesis protein COQ4
MATYPELHIHRAFPETAPLPPRNMEWRKAFRLARGMNKKFYDPAASYELVLLMDGGDSERLFQQFLTEPGAHDLIADRPDLAEVLADREALAAMGEGSLGRAYLELTQEDGYTANGLVQMQDQVPSFGVVAPDPIRRWFNFRAAALHDLVHALTGYGRDKVGEVGLIVFTAASYPMRFLRFYALLSGLTAFADPGQRLRNLAYVRQAWERGRRSRIPLSARWEKLLPLQIDEIHRMMQIPTVKEIHPEGILCDERGTWVPVQPKKRAGAA